MPGRYNKHGFSRREFVKISATSAGAVAAGSLTLLHGCADPTMVGPNFGKGNGKGGGGGGNPGTTRNPLRRPPAWDGGPLTEAITPDVELGGGATSDVWAYNGSFPGPTIDVVSGDLFSVDLYNALPDETITHWHGMIVDAMNDGHPRHAFLPGESPHSYAFTVNQRACLNWYHPHPHEKTGEQVNLGLAGAFIIRDGEEAGLGLPSTGRDRHEYEWPLIIRDATFDKSGNIRYRSKNSGYEGNTPLVNGTLDAGLEVRKGLYRFRILNGSNARIYDLALDWNGEPVPFILIGNDGGFIPGSPVDIATITTSPAERLDVLIDFSGMNLNDKVMLKDLRSGWDLLEFTVVEGDADQFTNPADLVLPGFTPYGTAVGDPRHFSFDGMSRINGQVYDMGAIPFSVEGNRTERWIFTTGGNAPHPVHVHAQPFEVVSRTGGRNTKFPWEEGLKDTVLLEDGETVEVLVRFDHERLWQHGPGENIYLIHCHKLEHEDMGMMMNFEILPPATA